MPSWITETIEAAQQLTITQVAVFALIGLMSFLVWTDRESDLAEREHWIKFIQVTTEQNLLIRESLDEVKALRKQVNEVRGKEC